MQRDTFEMEDTMYDDVKALKARMGCRTKSETYRALLSTGIEAKKKEFKME